MIHGMVSTACGTTNHKFHVGCFINIGTKNVAKELKKVCRGAVRGRDVTWFTQLSDKGACVFMSLLLHAIVLLLCTFPTCIIAKSTKTHLYWCMKNCNGNPAVLRARIMGISKHFQVSFFLL